jgi:hypothetical protein
LPEQVGVIEGLAALSDQLPNLIPLDDQHLLAFLSELLKMASVADGEMSDPNFIGSSVDRNGFVVPAEEQSKKSENESKGSPPFRASSLFLRRECVVYCREGKIVVSAELPLGIQLRISTIALLRSVIRGHPDTFFDSDTSTPVGTYAITRDLAFAIYCNYLSQPIAVCRYSFSQETFDPMSSAFCFAHWYLPLSKLLLHPMTPSEMS